MNQRFITLLLLFTLAFMFLNLSRERARMEEERKRIEAAAAEKEQTAENLIRNQDSSQRLTEAGVEPLPELPLEYFTLGSLAADADESLTLTLTNRGASVERIELTAREKGGGYLYRSLEGHGYPGYLALIETPSGLQIGSIAPGSPAALAANADPTSPDGLRPGDYITAVGNQPVRTLTDYYNAIRLFNAGQTCRFEIIRPADAALYVSGDLAADTEDAFVGSEQTTPIAENPEREELSPPARGVESTDAAISNNDQTVKEMVEDAPDTDVDAANATDSVEAAPGAAVAEGNETSADTPATADGEATIPSATENLGPTGTAMAYTLQLDEQPLDILRDPNRYPSETVDGNLHRDAFLTSLQAIGPLQATDARQVLAGFEAMVEGNWKGQVDADGRGVTFELPLRPLLVASGVDADLTIRKSYRLQAAAPELADNFDFDVTVSIVNAAEQPIEVAVRQEGPSGLTLEGWWYTQKQGKHWLEAAGDRDVIFSRADTGYDIIARGAINAAAVDEDGRAGLSILGPETPEESRLLRYLGVDSQYFAVAVLPPEGSEFLDNLQRAAAVSLTRLEGPEAVLPDQAEASNVGCYFDYVPATLQAGESLEHRFRVYAGPKDGDILANYGMADAVYYGWSIFAVVAKPLGWILHGFYAVVRNYGIAIMLLTVLVRSLMFPLSWKAGVMSQRMQQLQPELKKLNEQYKEDFQRRGQETQKLYKKYKINPLAGCLPVFIQLPIFIGLYRTLSTDVALRQKAFLPGLEWCSNLAGPDQFALLPAWMPEYFIGKGTGWLGPYFNLLPIITCILFIVQQKMLMPPAADEQTRMTQRIMMFMTVFMAIFFYKVPAGLCIYFITSSIWSLVERQMVKKFLPPTPAIADVPTPQVDSPDSRRSRAKEFIRDGRPPEKLSDVFPFLKRFEKPDANGDVDGPSNGQPPPSGSGGGGDNRSATKPRSQRPPQLSKRRKR